MRLKPVDVNDLIGWLDEGAPHVIFNMAYAYIELAELDEDLLWLDPQIDEKPDCGTVCCMAGYINQRSGITQKQADEMGWGQLQVLALRALNHPLADSLMVPSMLPLFDPYYAPDHATPQQAAEALRNWVAHDMNLEFNPW